ncbi:unnamed protein product [Ectocarpus sp. 12 AP-2014]
MKNTLAWMAWLLLGVVSPTVLAVGLGHATVSSYLGAPLEAAIPLLASSDYALSDIHVSVAAPSDFAAAGLEWSPLVAGVHAQVVEYQGDRQVRLSSGQAMHDPWLDLLLTLEYPGGRQFSDATLLFDPQGYSRITGQEGPVQVNTQRPAIPPNPDNVSMLSRERQLSNASSSGGNTAYFVNNGDTLWGIAERIKPTETTVQQMMVALLEANPSVFPDGNIHGMRAGQTLSVPDIQRVQARSHADSAAAIQVMNVAWRAHGNGSPQAVAIAPVSDASIEAAHTLHADESSVANEAESSQTIDTSETLTRGRLTEPLYSNQITLQQVIEERELMRSELNALRGEVASLTQELSDALAAEEKAAQDPSLAPLAASIEEAGSQGVSVLISQYQWPFVPAAAAIALLIGVWVWLRKRREEAWEVEPFAEPVVRPTASPSAEPMPAFKVAEKPLPKADTSGAAIEAIATLPTGDGQLIDYYPPTLKASSSSAECPRTETPMQPTVEFAIKRQTIPEAPASKPSRLIDEEWEIEEVAFTSRGRDNGDPPKSSK